MSKGKLAFITCLLPLALIGCGKSNDAASSAQPASASPATAPAPAASIEDSNPTGAKVFKTVCSMCHQTGASGSPVFGNKQDWAPRIAKGKDTLYKHALGGFTGDKGTMPAHGGNPSLKDEEVKAAVDYMVAKAS